MLAPHVFGQGTGKEVSGACKHISLVTPSGTFLSRSAVTAHQKWPSCIPSRSIVSALFRSLPSGSGFRSQSDGKCPCPSQAGMRFNLPSGPVRLHRDGGGNNLYITISLPGTPGVEYGFGSPNKHLSPLTTPSLNPLIRRWLSSA